MASFDARRIHYKIDSEKCAEAASRCGRAYDEIKAVCGYDWPEGQEHQDWLDTATAEEIANWADRILMDEDGEN